MKAQTVSVHANGVVYICLKFVCPGCMEKGGSGLHMLPVNSGHLTSPSWDWDGNLEAPTLNPSILTHQNHAVKGDFVCHSFLRAGVFEFLSDSTHSLAGKFAPMGDLPEWAVKE